MISGTNHPRTFTSVLIKLAKCTVAAPQILYLRVALKHTITHLIILDKIYMLW